MSDEQKPRSDTPEGSESSPIYRHIVDEHEEEVVEPGGQRVRHRGVYLLPNLFTTAALFSGFFAIISAVKGHFDYAGMAIIIAQLLDGFDGRVARMTNTTSAFGVEYDSLSDMVSFGLAPSLVIFTWGLEPIGKFGWVAAFLFTACAAMRLARFNTQVATVDKRYFVGLASPPAAAILATIVWCWHDVVPPKEVAYLLGFLVACVGLLMVSNIRYTSFKGLNMKGRVPFVAMLAGLIIFTIIVLDPPTVLLVMACVYTVSGPVMWGVNLVRAKKQAMPSDPIVEVEDPVAPSAKSGDTEEGEIEKESALETEGK